MDNIAAVQSLRIPVAVSPATGTPVSPVASSPSVSTVTAAPAPGLPAPVASGEGSAPSAEQIRNLDQLLQQRQQHLSLSVDDKSGHSVIKIIDSESGDVIRQLPSEATLKLAETLSEQGSGLLNDRA